LNEPILRKGRKRFIQADVAWLVKRMSNLSTAQQGYDFEQIAVRKVAAALLEGTLSITNTGEEALTVSKVPDPQTGTTATASATLTLEEFLWRPQTTTMFLPANKNGPDVVFWVCATRAMVCCLDTGHVLTTRRLAENQPLVLPIRVL
jgi:hypothetical protein